MKISPLQRKKHSKSADKGTMTSNDTNIQTTMTKIFCSIFLVCFTLGRFLTTKKEKKNTTSRRTAAISSSSSKSSSFSSFQCQTNPSKKAAEKFTLTVFLCWITSIAIIILLKLYEGFTRWHYLLYCGTCALPYIVYPLWKPFEEDKGVPFGKDTWKANAWIGILSFVSNYIWTHYFYSVLNAKYTFDAHRLNDVPISMYLMTTPYLCFTTRWRIRFLHED